MAVILRIIGTADRRYWAILSVHWQRPALASAPVTALQDQNQYQCH